VRAPGRTLMFFGEAPNIAARVQAGAASRSQLKLTQCVPNPFHPSHREVVDGSV
jgi:hypothetical protein